MVQKVYFLNKLYFFVSITLYILCPATQTPPLLESMCRFNQRRRLFAQTHAIFQKYFFLLFEYYTLQSPFPAFHRKLRRKGIPPTLVRLWRKYPAACPVAFDTTPVLWKHGIAAAIKTRHRLKAKTSNLIYIHNIVATWCVYFSTSHSYRHRNV